MLKIYVVRHGQDEDNANGILNGRRDKPLTELGLAQADETAHKIQDLGLRFDATYASPLQRAHTTGQVITHVLGLPDPVVLPDLIEHDFGIMTGQPHTAIVPMCAPDILYTDTVTWFLKPKNGETYPDMVVRAKKLLIKLHTLHPDGTILLATHGTFGKMIYAAYYDIDWLEVLKLFHFGNSDLLLLAPDSPASDPHVHKIVQHNS